MATEKLPPAEVAAQTAVLEPAGAGPMSRKQLMGQVNIPGALPKDYVHRKEPDEGPARGKEVGVRKASSKSEVYERGFAKGGSASSRADGIAKRGKTRGTIVMCKGGMYK